MSNNDKKRRDNFVRLAENRVTRAMKQIRLIGNLSNRKSYECSQKDIDKIFRALDRELKTAKARFESDAESSGQIFKL